MSAAIMRRHARVMCRGFGSVAVRVGSNAAAPDGQARRGLLSIVDRITDDSVGQVVERAQILTVPTDDVRTVARGTVLTVDGQARTVRDKLLIEDGALCELVLVGGV
jgi:hypothetical protein